MKPERHHSDPDERPPRWAPAGESAPRDAGARVRDAWEPTPRNAHPTPRNAQAPDGRVPDAQGPDGRVHDAQGPDAREELLKCVWSAYPNYERDCRSRIPASVVVKAWQREMQLKGTVEGFFYFAWRSGVWLAFGLPDGGVRGVYCPTHCSERDSREAGGEDEPQVHRPDGIALQ